jgi:hypothetical protein
MVNDDARDDDSANPPITELRELYSILEHRSYRTYAARLQASIRLAARSRGWNAALISTSAATTIASVGLLTDQSIYGNAGSTLLVCVSILALIASLVTSGLNYSGRSRNMFLNYRRIQQLSSKVERDLKTPGTQTLSQLEILNQTYDSLLDESENHTGADHLRAMGESRKSWPVVRENLLTWIPYASLVVPLALVIPLAKWLLTAGP